MSEKRTANQQDVLKENQNADVEKEGRPADTGENVPGYVTGETSQQAAQRVEEEREKSY